MKQHASAKDSIRSRGRMIVAICAVWTLALGGLQEAGFTPFEEAEWFCRDWMVRLGRTTEPDPNLVLVGIDKPNYGSYFNDQELAQEPVLWEMQADFPWSRAVWGKMIEKLVNAGAKVIVIDLVFATPGRGDEELRAAVETYKDRVVLGYNINVNETEQGAFVELLLPHQGLINTHELRSPVIDGRLGFVNIWPDFDGNFRRAAFVRTGDQAGVADADVELESLAARTLRAAGREDAIPHGTDLRLIRFTAPGGQVFQPIPVGDVLSPRMWQTNLKNGAAFADKIVLIGPMAAIFHDEHPTPFSLPRVMAGPEIHLQILNAALRCEFLTESSRAAERTATALAGLVAAALCFLVPRPGYRLATACGLAGAWPCAGLLLYNTASWYAPMVVPLGTLGACSLTTFAYDFVLESLEKMKLRNTMGLYFSPRVLEAVLADPGSMEPRRADVTLLLTDLRNFTPLAEALGPQGMFQLLNQVFEVQTQAIMDEEGNLEHFLGDQFLSYWGAPQAQPDAADRSLRAAFRLIQAMDALYAGLPPEVARWFGYGVALHAGPVLVGNKGSARRLDYGLVGDSVNEAARVEALTKFYRVRLLVTAPFLERLSSPPLSRVIDRVIVKGKSEPVILIEPAHPLSPPDFAERAAIFSNAFAHYEGGRFAEAHAVFETLARECGDGPSTVLAARCELLIQSPPIEWMGVWKLDAK